MPFGDPDAANLHRPVLQPYRQRRDRRYRPVPPVALPTGRRQPRRHLLDHPQSAPVPERRIQGGDDSSRSGARTPAPTAAPAPTPPRCPDEQRTPSLRPGAATRAAAHAGTTPSSLASSQTAGYRGSDSVTDGHSRNRSVTPRHTRPPNFTPPTTQFSAFGAPRCGVPNVISARHTRHPTQRAHPVPGHQAAHRVRHHDHPARLIRPAQCRQPRRYVSGQQLCAVRDAPAEVIRKRHHVGIRAPAGPDARRPRPRPAAGPSDAITGREQAARHRPARHDRPRRPDQPRRLQHRSLGQAQPGDPPALAAPPT